MAAFPFEALVAPVSVDLPCGPDLELEGDAEFMRFLAQIEGVLPESFLSFNRRDADLQSYIATAGTLLKRTADLRLLVAAAKLFILDQDLGSFTRCVEVLAGWLEERWEGLHPDLLGEDPVMRVIALQTLDDAPHTVLPLQVAPLFRSRRIGHVSLRSFLLSEGKVQPRRNPDSDEMERVPTGGDLASAIKDAEAADVTAAWDHAQRLSGAVARVEQAVDAHASGAAGLSLDRLKGVAKQLVETLQRVVAEKDPSLAPASAGGAEEAGDAGEGGSSPSDSGPMSVQAMASLPDVAAALLAAERYFVRHEPSSPVRMLLAQTRALLGRSFFEVLSALSPSLAGQAAIRPVRGLPIELPLERLSQLLPSDGSEDASDSGGGWDESGEGADENEGVEAQVTAAESPAAPEARTRRDALALLEAAAAFLRQAEPSSPIPLMVEHARQMAGRDFTALLRDLLPASALHVDED